MNIQLLHRHRALFLALLGGAVITEAGNDPKVSALVYIAAFAPDGGESVNTLIANPPPGAPVPPILPPRDGFLFLSKADTQLARSPVFRVVEAKYRLFAKVPQEWRRPHTRSHEADRAPSRRAQYCAGQVCVQH